VERTEIIPPIGPISIEVDETKPIIVERTEMIPPPSVPILIEADEKNPIIAEGTEMILPAFQSQLKWTKGPIIVERAEIIPPSVPISMEGDEKGPVKGVVKQDEQDPPLTMTFKTYSGKFWRSQLMYQCHRCPHQFRPLSNFLLYNFGLKKNLKKNVHRLPWRSQFLLNTKRCQSVATRRKESS